MRDILSRLSNGAIAFAGIIVSATGPIDFKSPQFWGGVVLAVIPALRNSHELMPKVKK